MKITSCSMRGNMLAVHIAGLLLFALSPAVADEPASYGIGRDATPEEIALWDLDVRPDGKGLPPGSGNVAQGEQIYAAKCAVCHGKTGVEGPNDRLVVHTADEPFPDSSDPESWQHRTIGNYWPYATTVFDYILRSMPLNMPGSLQPDEVYSLTAYLLHRNHIISADTEINARTLPEIQMPARDNFVLDNRLNYKEVH